MISGRRKQHVQDRGGDPVVCPERGTRPGELLDDRGVAHLLD